MFRPSAHLLSLNKRLISQSSRGSSLDDYCQGSLGHRSAKPLAPWPFQSHRWRASISYYSSLSRPRAISHSWPIIHPADATAHLPALHISLIHCFQTNVCPEALTLHPHNSLPELRAGRTWQKPQKADEGGGKKNE